MTHTTNRDKHAPLAITATATVRPPFFHKDLAEMCLQPTKEPVS